MLSGYLGKMRKTVLSSTSYPIFHQILSPSAFFIKHVFFCCCVFAVCVRRIWTALYNCTVLDYKTKKWNRWYCVTVYWSGAIEPQVHVFFFFIKITPRNWFSARKFQLIQKKKRISIIKHGNWVPILTRLT